MPDKILVTLACGTDNPNRATRALFIAATAKKKGKDVCMFLLDEGVYLAKKGITANMRAATGDDADDHLTYMQEFEVPILVCTPCAVARQIGEEDLIEGARMAVGADLIDLACERSVISL